jgi:glucose/arabinose dehydrogenase
MDLFSRLASVTLMGLCALAGPVSAQLIQTQAGVMRAEPLVEGLFTPWAFATLPGGTILITERDGSIRAHANGRDWEITEGLPDIWADGQGGLLDILVPRDFAETREIYLTFSKKQFIRGEATALYRAKLSADETRLEDGDTVFEIARGTFGGYHFGSRLIEGPDGAIYMTIGDRGVPESAQDTGNHAGSVLRLTRDGDPMPGNPLADQRGAQDEIWSFGHRNPQGMGFDAAGQLWTVEHGAKGGDEVNRITPGANYGWPVISYGVNYNGTKIGEGTDKAGLEQPAFYWDPSIAPSDMVFYQGAVADWQDDLFVGSLKFDMISRLSGEPLQEVERISGAETVRIRDVDTGPDGMLWFLSQGNGALYRLVPE